MAEYETLHDEF